MIQKDYIMRMIEQLSKFLAKVLFKKNEGNHEEALSIIESAVENMFGLSLELFNTLSAKDIAELLGISKDKSTGGMKCIVAARLLKEKAEIHELEGKDYSFTISCYQKALSLYLQGMLSIGYTELDLTNYYADINQIANKLGSSIPNDLMHKMFSLHTSLEEYDKAEDWLFRLRDIGYPDIMNIGMEFFKKLAKVDESKLRKGNLRREEVDEGLTDFINCNSKDDTNSK